MSRWWRAYDEALDDPKLQRLSADLFRFWFNLMCIASKNDGTFPAMADIAFSTRLSEDRATRMFEELQRCGLIDETADGTFHPHNWNGRQYKSDVSTDRVKRFRKRQRNVSETPNETPPETESETDTEAEKKEDAAIAAPDARTRLFTEGLGSLHRQTGKPESALRPLVGRWLRDVEDDAVLVFRVIEDAERNRVADAVAWITRALKPKARPQNAATSKDITRQKWNDALERLGEFATTPASSDVCEEAVRFLPAAGSGKP